MSRGWKIALYIWGGICAFVLFAATVPAHQAMSNLQSWADFFGFTALATALSEKYVDYVAQVAITISSIILYLAARRIAELQHAHSLRKYYERLQNRAKQTEEKLRRPELD